MKSIVLLSLLILSSLTIKNSFAEDLVTMFGKLKVIENGTIKIQLKSGEIIQGPRKLVSNFEESDLNFQMFEIDKGNLKQFNLVK